jgi:hypothetical protein
MGVPVLVNKKQLRTTYVANYEPGGRRFESFRARHNKQQVT